MDTHPLDVLQPPSRILTRAQTEPFSFALFEGDVLVRNEQYLTPETHEYRVQIDDGIPISCTCPADRHYEGACKHRVAVAIRRPIIDTASMMHEQLIADGGSTSPPVTADESNEETSQEVTDETADEEPEDCDCENLIDDFPCWPCVRDGHRELPR